MGFGSLNSQQRVMVLLELLGGPKFASEMKGAAVSTGLLGRNVDAMGKKMEQSARRTFMQNQALYTLRRYAFFGTIAVTAMGAAVIKLGYNYLSAMQQARVALSPVIKDHAVLEGYLNRLFKIAKYSPFVITDLAVAFRQMYAGLHPAGINAPQIIRLMQALTDFMSASGKTGPGQLQRVALAIQHLAYAGRVTGYAALQLGRLGIPVAPILRSFGITDVRNLSKQNISADAFIKAIIGYSSTGQFKNAARRQALKTLPGLFQVAKDAISQISGRLIQGGYGNQTSGAQGLMSRLFAPGGTFDKVGNQTTGRGTLFALNKAVTGNTGLARGLLVLLTTARNLGAVFAHVIIPAWIMGLHALIVFYPILKGVNWALGLLAKHGTVAKWVFAALAAEFFITHAYLTGLWAATRLYNIATLGSVGPLKKLIKFLWALRTVELVGGIRRLKEYAFETKMVASGGLGMGKVVSKNTGIMAKFTRAVYGAAAAFKAYRSAAVSAGLATALGIGGSAAVATGGFAALAYFSREQGSVTRVGRNRYGNVGQTDKGKIVQMTPRGPIAVDKLDLGDIGSSAGDTVIHTHVHIDRKQVAEAVSRAKADKASTR